MEGVFKPPWELWWLMSFGLHCLKWYLLLKSWRDQGPVKGEIWADQSSVGQGEGPQEETIIHPLSLHHPSSEESLAGTQWRKVCILHSVKLNLNPWSLFDDLCDPGQVTSSGISLDLSCSPEMMLDSPSTYIESNEIVHREVFNWLNDITLPHLRG